MPASSPVRHADDQSIRIFARKLGNEGPEVPLDMVEVARLLEIDHRGVAAAGVERAEIDIDCLGQ